MIELLPMSVSEFEAFMQVSMADHAAGQVRAGLWEAQDAEANIVRLRAQFLPDGLETQGHYFFNIRATENGQVVGGLWYMLDEGERQILVVDIQIHPGCRRQGYGEHAFLAMEAQARQRGVETINLHVFEHNTPARRMYEKLGYTGQGDAMRKRVV